MSPCMHVIYVLYGAALRWTVLYCTVTVTATVRLRLLNGMCGCLACWPSRTDALADA